MTPAKRLLLVGGSATHLSKARASGADIVWIRMPDEVGPADAERGVEVVRADYADEETLGRLASKAHAERPFDAAVSLTEPGLDPAARVNDLLGLTGTGYEVAHRFTDKYLMRRHLEETAAPGVRIVASALVEDHESLRRFGAAHGYPFIVKPTCGTASFGVLKVDGEDRTEAAWQEIGRLRSSDHPLVHAYDLGEFIMEEYIDGPLCSAETFSFAGHHVVVTVTEAITEDSNHVHVGHAVPARISPAVEADVVRVTASFLDAMGYRDGASHTEFKLTPRGPVVIESQARVGGALLGDLMESVYGVDLQELAFSWPLGEAQALRERPEPRGGSASWLVVTEPGKVREIRGLEAILAKPDTVGVDLWVGPGDVVRPFDGQWDGLGHVASSGDDTTDAIDRCRRSMAELQILTE
ncbi:ATP-grasp domain-containing protein [Streptomyces sp. NPDC048514]|uniref:ATP-grasp domain-containing protein n=1 Tax=Streptomyces sp. NPDC048514 TaxID=3365564 RepID=UPI003713AA7A